MTSPSPSGIGAVHRCPVPGCPAHCTAGHVACRRHWLAIPKKHRGVLAEAFRARTSEAETFTAAVTLTQQLIVDYARRAA
jgi:hypothetical protein